MHMSQCAIISIAVQLVEHLCFPTGFVVSLADKWGGMLLGWVVLGEPTLVFDAQFRDLDNNHDARVESLE